MHADRFNEDEAAAIFARAAKVETSGRQPGYQVDMRTSKTSARSLMTVGGVMTGISGAFLAVAALTGSIAPGDVADFTPILAIGAGLFSAGVLQIPAWARRRREQFERIAERLRATIC